MIYFFDGSEEGFLSAFPVAFRDEAATVTSRNAQMTLGQTCTFVPTDHVRAERARQRLLSFDGKCMSDLNFLLRSGDAAAENVAFRYFRLLARKKSPVRRMLADGDVIAATECIRRVTYEVHRMHGFLRFMESASGALYAPVSPDHDIVDLLVPHFRARLSKIPFVIHDVGRKKAAVCDGTHTFCVPLEKADVVLSADEAGWQALWKQYYADVDIPERRRIRQMRGYLPVRYWKFLPEKQGD